MPSKYIRLIDAPPLIPGCKVGRLTVISEGARRLLGGRRRKTWDCTCECGGSTNALDQHLRSGRTTSCGCAARESSAETRHGATAGGGQTKTYMAWRDMLQRCNNPKHKSFHNYGGRGIAVCDRWGLFDNFLEDMGECPTGMTLDRRDPNLGYFKGNCHWADWDEQARNKRSGGTRMITHNGETLSPSQWAEKLGLTVQAIRVRRQKGWPTELVLKPENLKGKNRNGRQL